MVQRNAVVVVLVLLLATASEAARYKGERIDVISGETVGRWIIKTKRPAGQDVLRTVVKCRPGRRCRPFPTRLRFDMVPGAGEYDWSATFDANGSPCTLEAYVYDQGFEGTYHCRDGGVGSINGRRVETSTPNPNPYP